MSDIKNVRTVVGEVVSTAREKTITVKVVRKRTHPKYKKYIKVSKKFHAHLDGDDKCGLGDTVMIEACRPISKTKTWKFVQVIESAE